MFGDGLEIRENLAWVELVGQSVDHRMGGVFGHLLDPILPKRAPDHAIGHAVEHACGIGDGLTSAQLGTGLIDDQRITTKLGDADGEAGTGTRAGFIEQYGDALRTGERLVVETILVELDGQFQHLLLFFVVQVVVT